MTHESYKSKLIWNIVEPGDPYDIRKSMIAKLPEHPKNFMGNNLEMVCLLQAAQIQRLTQFLDEYKLKYKQVSRVQLDRHSYQIQIKQLTQKIFEYTSLKTDNQKLKLFLQRQNGQIDDLKKRVDNSAQMSHLQAKYEGLLIELKTIREKNAQIERANNSIHNQAIQWRQKYEKCESGQSLNINKQRDKWEKQFYRRIQLQIQQMSYKYELKIQSYETQLKLMKQQLGSKNMEIQALLIKKEAFLKEIHTLESQLLNKAQLQSQYYSKSHQIGIINRILQQKNLALQKLYQKYESQQKYIISLEQQLKSQNFKQNLQQQCQKLQLKCAMFSAEIQRLNDFIKSRSGQWHDFNLKTTQLKQQMNILQMKCINYMKKIQKLELRNQQLQAQWESKQNDLEVLRNAKNQIQRLQSTLRVKNQQIATLEHRLKIIQGSTAQSKFLKETITQKDQIIQSLKDSFREKDRIVENLKRDQQNLQHLRLKINEQERIISNLNISLSQKDRISDSLKGTIQQKNNQIRQLKIQLQQLGQAKQKLQMSTQLKSKIDELEGVIANLQGHLKDKDIIIENLRVQLKNRLKQMEEFILRQKKYEQNQRNYQSQIRNLNLRAQSLQSQLNFKINQYQSISHQFNVYRSTNENKQSQFQDLRNRNEMLRRQIQSLQRQIERNKHLPDQIISLKSTIQQLRLRFEQTRKQTIELDNLKFYNAQMQRDIDDLKRKLEQSRSLEMELQNWKNKNLQLQRNNQKLQREVQNSKQIIIQKYQIESNAKIRIFENRISLLQRENREFKTLEDNLRNRILQLEKRLRQGEYENQSLRGKLQMYNDNDSKMLYFQKQINRLKSSQQQYRQRLFQLQEAYDQMASQLKQKTQMLKKLNQFEDKYIVITNQLNNKDNYIVKLENQKNRLNFEYLQMKDKYRLLEVNSHDQSNQKIFKIQEQYRIKINELNRRIQQKDREFRERVQPQNLELIQLRTAIKQYQNTHKHITYERDQFYNELNNLKLQIDYKNKTIFQYENKIALLSQQIERLDNILEQRGKYIKTLQEKISNQQRTDDYDKDNKIRELRQENQRANRKIDQIFEKLKILENNKNYYENEHTKLIGQIQKLQRQLQTERIKINTIVRQNQVLNEEYSKLKFLQTQQNTYQYTNQIETLRKENQKFRENLKNQEEIVKNNLKKSEYNSADQIQIQNLRTIVAQLEDINRHTIAQRDQLFNYSHQLQQKLYETKDYHQSFQNQKHSIRDSIRRVNDEYTVLRVNHNVAIQQANRLRIQLHNRTQQIKRYHLTISQLRRNQQQYIIRIQQYDRRVLQLQQKLSFNVVDVRITELTNERNVLIGQINRLKHQTIDRVALINQVNRLKLQSSDRNRLITQINRLQHDKGGNKNNFQQISQLKYENEQLNEIAHELQAKFHSYEDKFIGAQKQLQRLNAVLKHKLQQLDHYKKICTQIEGTNKHYQLLLHQNTKEITRLQQNKSFISEEQYHRLERKINQLQQYTKKCIHYQSKIKQYEIHISQYTKQINKLKQYQKICVSQQQYHRLIQTIKMKDEVLQQWDSKYSTLYRTYRNLQQSHEKLTNDHDVLRRSITEYQSKLQDLEKQFNSLNNLLKQLKIQNKNLKASSHAVRQVQQKNRQLSRQIDRLNLIIQQYKREIEEVRLRLTDNVALQKRIQQHMGLFVVLFAEIESLRRRVKDSEKQCEDVRRSSLSPFRVDKGVNQQKR